MARNYPLHMGIVLLVIGILCFPLAVQGESGKRSAWVVVDGAKLKAETAGSSETLAVLSSGVIITISDKKKKWYRAATDDGKAGWIYRGNVSFSPPVEEVDEDLGLDDLTENNHLLAGADTARSLRGRKGSENAGPDILSQIPEKYHKALETVMSFYCGDDEIDRFLMEGNIGEYAR